MWSSILALDNWKIKPLLSWELSHRNFHGNFEENLKRSCRNLLKRKKKKKPWSQETGMHLQGLSDDLEFLEAVTCGHEINWHGNIKQRIDVHTSLIHSCWSHFSELNSVPNGEKYSEVEFRQISLMANLHKIRKWIVLDSFLKPQ